LRVCDEFTTGDPPAATFNGPRKARPFTGSGANPEFPDRSRMTMF
jgi:hypothetical protein